MKKAIRIILPIILVLVIILCTVWYLFVYDKPFTIDVLLSWARQSEAKGNHEAAAWFYNLAYSQSDDNDSIAIELANQYKVGGNYTKAEYTLVNAIADGGGIDLYIALSKIYVEQDKLLDAVTMLNQVSNKEIKARLDVMRPKAPTVTPDEGLYRQYISVTVKSDAPEYYVTGNGTYPSTKNPVSNRTITLVDGVNTILAVAIADNGLVSPLAEYEFTVGGVVKEVNFADKAVEKEVRRLLALDDDKPVFTNQIWTITDFTMPKNAVSYADLQYFIYLETLVIEDGVSERIHYLKDLEALKELKICNTDISSEDLVVIAGLPELKKLTLQGCNLTSIDSLSTAKKLVYLDLSNNVIRNIRALSKMEELTELYLQNNAVVDLTSISGLVNLTKLNVSTNALTSLSPVAELTQLTELHAHTNQIDNITGIINLTDLEILNLSYNQLTDIADLSACTALTELYVSNNEIESIDCISDLKKLLHIDFSFNKVTKIPKLDGCALASVFGANNAITNIDNLAVLKQLNTVDMDYNKDLKSISALADCRNLIVVNVYGTKVTNVKALTDCGIVVNYNPVQ